MNMHYQQNTGWLDEIESALKIYRQNTEHVPSEPDSQDDPLQEPHPSKKLLYRVEQKIRDAKHVIRRCRGEHVWMPALVQEPTEQVADITFNLHSLDAQHRYEKALQKHKRLLNRYERIKNVLKEENVYAKKEQ